MKLLLLVTRVCRKVASLPPQPSESGRNGTGQARVIQPHLRQKQPWARCSTMEPKQTRRALIVLDPPLLWMPTCTSRLRARRPERSSPAMSSLCSLFRNQLHVKCGGVRWTPPRERTTARRSIVGKAVGVGSRGRVHARWTGWPVQLDCRRDSLRQLPYRNGFRGGLRPALRWSGAFRRGRGMLPCSRALEPDRVRWQANPKLVRLSLCRRGAAQCASTRTTTARVTTPRISRRTRLPARLRKRRVLVPRPRRSSPEPRR